MRDAPTVPLQKPRGRKRPSHKKAYASVVVLVLLGLSSLAYAYVNGFLPGGGNNTTGSTTSTVACPTPPSNSTDAYACIYTTQGAFEVQLFASKAPKTVANFVSLANSGFFDGLAWWRVEHGFVIQTGDPNVNSTLSEPRSKWGLGTSGVSIPFEYSTSLHNYAGYLAMASTAPKVGGSSQFFINLADNSQSLDSNYAVFGRVISGGLTVVNKLGSVPVELQPGSTAIHEPVTPDYITSVVVLKGPGTTTTTTSSTTTSATSASATTTASTSTTTSAITSTNTEPTTNTTSTASTASTTTSVVSSSTTS